MRAGAPPSRRLGNRSSACPTRKFVQSIGPASRTATATKFIQAKKSVEEEQPVIYVSVVVHDDGQIDIEGHDLSLVMWNHDPDRLQSALGYRARVVWKPRYHVLKVSGYIFNMADLAEQAACLQKVAPPPELDTTVDRVLWEARTYGGYTVPVSSLRPGDEAEIAEALCLTERKGDTRK